MEKLQGPINPCLIGEDLEVGWLEEFISNNSGNLNFEVPYNTEDGNFGEQDYNFPNLEDKMSFLQMLQSVEPSFHHQQQHFQQQQQQLQQDATFPALMQLEPNLQLLLRLQQQKVAYYTSPSEVTNNNNNNNIVDNNMIIMDDLHSTEVKSESEVHQVVESVEQQQPDKCNSNSKSVGVRRSSNNNNKRRTQSVKSCATTTTQYVLMKKTSATVAGVSTTSVVVVGQREKKKRKRSIRPAKNKEEVETQRMTHIAVERNRRRQMNEHLNALRSLMPPSYVQRGDQASIIGGAIDFVKELEQMLQSLEAQKKMKQYEENGDVSLSTSSTSSSSNLHLGNFFTPFQSRNSLHYSQDQMNGNEEEGVNIIRKSNNNNNNEEFIAEKRSALADIEVVVIQNHVNLKIQCQRRPGQLLKAIVAFEELRLTVLHLNITSLHTLVHYSFNLKIEDECKLGTADEVARAVHQIFSLIHMG